MRDRRPQVEVVPQVEREHGPVDRALDRGARELAVALRRVAVAGREQGAVDGDRQEERRAGDELLAVDVAAVLARRPGVVPPRLGRRHTHHAEERAELDRAPLLVPTDAVRELPVEPELVAEGHPPPGGSDLVDADGQRAACPRAAHLDGPDERMAGVQLLVARLESLT